MERVLESALADANEGGERTGSKSVPEQVALWGISTEETRVTDA
jgi:hypothetical protein